MATQEGKQRKIPFMTAKKRLSVSDDELDAFYKSLREYYLNIPYDSALIKKQELYYKRMARISRFFAMLKGTKVLHGDRIVDSQAMIYTSNHIGSYDQFYMPSALGIQPIHYLVKKKVTTWPVRWNMIYKPTGAVVVDLDSLSSWQQAKAELLQYLLHGNRVFIYGEGSRRGEDNMGDFSPGLAQVAQEAGLQVGTFAIKNCSRILSKNTVICVGETFTIDPREDIRAATERIKCGVVNAYNEILEYESKRKKAYGKPQEVTSEHRD